VQLARQYGFIIAQDAAYAEMYYEEPPLSILQIEGAREVAIELHSFSKTFNMTGWRLGFAVGGAPIIAALGQVKANCDSGIFTAIQFAGITALEQYDELTPPIRNLYRERRDTLVSELRAIGWDIPSPPATFYVWIPCPAGYSSTELCTKLLDEADIVTTPGIGFGETAGGYIRMALTVETPRIREAAARISKLKL
jgi:LL-diaminopimelate aminotransferase